MSEIINVRDRLRQDWQEALEIQRDKVKGDFTGSYNVSEYVNIVPLGETINSIATRIHNRESVPAKRIFFRNIYNKDIKEICRFGTDDYGIIQAGFFDGEKLKFRDVDPEDAPYVAILIDKFDDFDITKVMNGKMNVFEKIGNLPDEFFRMTNDHDNDRRANKVFSLYFSRLLQASYLNAMKEGNAGDRVKLTNFVNGFTHEFPEAFREFRSKVYQVRRGADHDDTINSVVENIYDMSNDLRNM